MRESKKDKDMRMLRSAGLSLASADRLAGSDGATPVALYALGGLAVLALAGAGVWAINLQAGQVTGQPVLAAAVTPAPAAESPESMEPVLAMPQSIESAEASAASVALSIADPETGAADLPWITALSDEGQGSLTPEEVVAPEVTDCVTELADAFSGLIFNFDAGSADIRPGDYDLLVSVGEQANACPDARVLIAGHSDSSGSDSLNLQLSWQRADSAVSVLDKLGIDVSQFETVGFGARTPLTQGSSTDEEINRRIELRVMREGGQL